MPAKGSVASLVAMFERPRQAEQLAKHEQPAKQEDMCIRLRAPKSGDTEEEGHSMQLPDGHIDILRPPLSLNQDAPRLCSQVDPESGLYKQLVAWFDSQWLYDGSQPAGIKAIFAILNNDNYRQFEEYAKGLGGELSSYSAHSEMPGNLNMLFHGTFLGCDFLKKQKPCGQECCKVCSIIVNGFAMEKVGSGHGVTWYGPGMYFSPSSAVAYKFSRTARAVLGVAVACGKVSVHDNNFADSSATKESLGLLEAGCHTRVVKNPSNAMETGVLGGLPHGAGQCKVADEVITFRPESTHAKYLFILDDPEPKGVKCRNYPVCCCRPYDGKKGNFCTKTCRDLAKEKKVQRWRAA